jgi:hypothetical protein
MNSLRESRRRRNMFAMCLTTSLADQVTNAVGAMTSASRSSHNEFAEGIVSSVSAAKHSRLQNKVQERIEADPPTENVIRSVIQSLPPQTIEGMLVGAAGGVMALPNEFKELYADLANKYPSPSPLVGTPRPMRLQPPRQDVVCTILPVGMSKKRNVCLESIEIPSLHLLLANLKHATSSEHQGPTSITKTITIHVPTPAFSNYRETSTPENECEHCCDAEWKFRNEQCIAGQHSQKFYGAQYNRFDSVENYY